MDLKSSEDRHMILVLIAIFPSSLVFLTTLGIVFGSLNCFLQSPKYALFPRTEETPVDFKTTFFPFGLLSPWNDVVVKIACTYLMVKNGIPRYTAII